MKKLTTEQKVTTQNIKKDAKQENKKETKAAAQCCAKVSNVVAGCHD